MVMTNQGELTAKEKFLRIYANLPIQAREEIIYVTNQKSPLTWNAAYIEIINDTPLSTLILPYLVKLNII